MKTISQHLKQAINALEFTNAGNLTTLTTMLDAPDLGASSARTEQRNVDAEQDAGAISASNSACC